MSDIGGLVEELIAAGTPAALAARIIARAFAAGAASAAFRDDCDTDYRSANAARQQRYRERKRNASVTNRNETVTRNVTPDTVTRNVTTVTNRNETVTNNVTRNAALYIDNNNSKKERARATQIPPGWKPDEELWAWSIAELGTVTRAERELDKFRDHHGAKGSTAKKWGLAWRNWVRRSLEYAPRAAPQAVSHIPIERMTIEEAVQMFAKHGHWSRRAPVSDICQAPPELLAKYGMLPDGRKIA